MKFNLDDYEPVEERIKKFYKDHKDGRIITFLRSEPNNMDFAVFEAQVFVGEELKATGWAQERRDPELSKSKTGSDYESVNFAAWLENAETSAIGRALANFNYQGNKRPSREEMNKVERSGNTRPANLTCPSCGKPKIIKSKYGEGWYCLECKTKFGKDEPRITVQFLPAEAETESNEETEIDNAKIPF